MLNAFIVDFWALWKASISHFLKLVCLFFLCPVLFYLGRPYQWCGVSGKVAFQPFLPCTSKVAGTHET